MLLPLRHERHSGKGPVALPLVTTCACLPTAGAGSKGALEMNCLIVIYVSAVSRAGGGGGIVPRGVAEVGPQGAEMEEALREGKGWCALCSVKTSW